MNETLTRRVFTYTGLAALAGIVGGLSTMLFKPRRSEAVAPHPTHLSDAPSTEGTFAEAHDGMVLSSDQERVRQWYKDEYGIEPVYNEEGHIISFISDVGDIDVKVFHDIFEESLEAGEFASPVPETVLREMERFGTSAAAGGIDTTTAATEAVGKTLH